LLFLAVLGPGIITANVDNDAGGIATYSVAGARYGYPILWLLLPTALALIIVQEMCARMGVVTAKGLADLIRERFGVKLTVLLMAALLFTNWTNTAAEFAGIAASGEIFLARPYSKFLFVPLSALLVWLLVVRGTYRILEKVFLGACVIYFAYPISAFLARPDWPAAGRGLLLPSGDLSPGYLAMAITVVGTSIAPWMQFYLQSSVVEKRVRIRHLRLSQLDTILGCLFAIVVAFFVTVACAATLHPQGIHVHDAKEAAEALRPLAGPYCSTLFAVGLLNASLFAASILPLSTAYYVCEGMGWERGLDRRFSEAKGFYLLYTALIALGAGAVLLPGASLLWIMLASQFANGLLLPAVLVLLVLLSSDRAVMRRFVNPRSYSALAWALTAALLLATLVLFAVAALRLS
jgi:Mn2+/Fe2+ NRAMP family transporter